MVHERHNPERYSQPPEYPKLFGREVPMRAVQERIFRGADAVRTHWDDEPYVDRLPDELRAVREAVVAEKKAAGQRVTNGPTVVLDRWELLNDALHLSLREGRYFDALATHGSLDRRLPSGETVRAVYGNPEALLTPEGFANSRLDRMIGMSAAIETNDGMVVLTERSAKVAIEPGSFHVGIAEGLHMKEMRESGIQQALQRVFREELGSGWNQDFEFVGGTLGISDQYLQPDLALYVRLPIAAVELHALAEQARGKWERSALHTVAFDQEHLEPLIQKQQWSPHALFALAVAGQLRERKK